MLHVDGYLDCFYIVVILNKAVITFMYKSIREHVFIFLE